MSARPANCRNQLRDDGKPYPRSGCAVCKDGGMRGCPYETYAAVQTTLHPIADKREARAQEAARDLRMFLAQRVVLNDDCRTAINQAFLAFATAQQQRISEGEVFERLRIMAKQKLPAEMDDEMLDGADWQGGYEYFCTESREIFALISSPVAPDGEGWRDISSAPKDGTQFLAFHPRARRYFIACFVDDGRLHNLSSNRWGEATHWMPLPPLPATHTGITPEEGRK